MNNKTSIAITSLMLLASASVQANQSLTLGSSALADGGTLPAQFSCEGAGISPPLHWSGVPEGTQSLLLIMDHQPSHDLHSHPTDNETNKPPKPLTSEKTAKHNGPEALRWYWTVYNISSDITGVSNGQSVGITGSNVVNGRNEYAPPCSKGPGLKSYTFHLYALATTLEITASKPVSATLLRTSMAGLVLDSDTLTVSFERSCQAPPLSPSNKPSSNKLSANPPSKLASKPRVQGEQSEDKQPPPPPTLPPCAK